TNAQSRAIEDALMREGVAYRIIGGVRFYERREIKDALAYLRLVINPHDDVSFRRVVNVPARGIGQTVLETIAAIHPETALSHLPLLSAGLQPTAGARSMWARLVIAIAKRQVPPRAHTALTAFRDLIAGLAADGASASVSTLVSMALERSGYIRELREERNEE